MRGFPVELIRKIALLLNLFDFRNLSRTCRRLHSCLDYIVKDFLSKERYHLRFEISIWAPISNFDYITFYQSKGQLIVRHFKDGVSLIHRFTPSIAGTLKTECIASRLKCTLFEQCHDGCSFCEKFKCRVLHAIDKRYRVFFANWQDQCLLRMNKFEMQVFLMSNETVRVYHQVLRYGLLTRLEDVHWARNKLKGVTMYLFFKLQSLPPEHL
jgi:hypothetical protein